MSQVVVELEKPLQLKNALVDFAKAIETEYVLEDKVKEKISEKRKLERNIIKSMGFRDKELKLLRSQKTKMLLLQIPFDPSVIQKLQEVREKINSDENIIQLKSEISRLWKKFKEVRKNNRDTYFNQIKPLIS